MALHSYAPANPTRTSRSTSARLVLAVTDLGSLGHYPTTHIMGAAYFIVLERKIDGLDAMIDGKVLARTAEILDALALQLGVRPISEFISIDPAQTAEFMRGEGVDVGNMELPTLQQFSAEEGLATVKALLSRPEAHPAIQDLRDCDRILSIAAKHGVGWHLEVDF